MKKALILNYHAILEAGEVRAAGVEGVYSLDRSEFLDQVASVRERGIPVITLNDYFEGKTGDSFSVIFTFDDGHASVYSLVAPLFQELGWPATLFVPANRSGGERMTDENIRELSHSELFTIGSHGFDHVDLTRISRVQIEKEVKQSKGELEAITGRPVSYFAFPFGRYSRKLLMYCRESGYKAVFSTRFAVNIQGRQGFLLNRYSIRRGTPMTTFTKLTDPYSSLFLIKTNIQTFKEVSKRVFGSKLTDRLNTWLHSIQSPN